MFYSTIAVIFLSAASALAAPSEAAADTAIDAAVDARAVACPTPANFGFEEDLRYWRTNAQNGAITTQIVTGARSGSKALYVSFSSFSRWYISIVKGKASLTSTNRKITATQDNTLANICTSPQYPCLQNGNFVNADMTIYAKKEGTGYMEIGLFGSGFFQTTPFTSTSWTPVSNQILIGVAGGRASTCVVLDIAKAGTSVTLDDLSLAVKA